MELLKIVLYSLLDCILSRVNDETRAINNNIFDGPSFGLDLYLCCGRKIFCKQHNYEKQIKIDNDDALPLDFFEVFQLCRVND
jgi:hypothetical protein